jgi:CBS domain-containing protein
MNRGTTLGAVAFGVGYLLGTVVNDRPVRFVRRSAGRARVRMASLGTFATGAAAWTHHNDDRVVDVREAREVMRPVRDTVGPKTSLRDAAAVMERTGSREVVVMKKQRVRGVLTDRDIAVRAVAHDMDPSRTPVRDVLGRADVWIAPTAPMAEAVSLMREAGTDRLAVVDASGRAVGIVGLDDAVSEDRGRRRRLLRSRA